MCKESASYDLSWSYSSKNTGFCQSTPSKMYKFSERTNQRRNLHFRGILIILTSALTNPVKLIAQLAAQRPFQSHLHDPKWPIWQNVENRGLWARYSA